MRPGRCYGISKNAVNVVLLTRPNPAEAEVADGTWVFLATSTPMTVNETTARVSWKNRYLQRKPNELIKRRLSRKRCRIMENLILIRGSRYDAEEDDPDDGKKNIKEQREFAAGPNNLAGSIS